MFPEKRNLRGQGTTVQVEALFLGKFVPSQFQAACLLECHTHTEFPLAWEPSLGPVFPASLVGVVLSADVAVLVSMCNTEICRKYMLGCSHDRNVFPICIWSSSVLPGV